MRCGVCHAPLQARGRRRKEYRDSNGRVYKVLYPTVYYPCPRLDDPEAHPARHRGRAQTEEETDERIAASGAEERPVDGG